MIMLVSTQCLVSEKLHFKFVISRISTSYFTSLVLRSYTIHELRNGFH